MKSERVENWWCGFEWCILNTEKLWSSSKFKKMKSLCNRRLSEWNPDTSKEIVRFVHEVHLVFAVTLLTFLHMLCGWNDDTMPIFNLFGVHLKCFSISGSYSSYWATTAWIRLETNQWARIQASRRPSRPIRPAVSIRPVSLQWRGAREGCCSGAYKPLRAPLN